MNKWKLEKLSKLCTRIGDGLHGTPEYSDDSDIFFINGNNLKSGKIEINESTKRISATELERNFIPLNDKTLLLSINGTLGSLAFYNNEKVMLGKSAAYLNFKTEINKFYYYYFQLDNVQQYFYNVATGSTIKNLSLKSIQDYEVPVPEKHEWENISNVLSALDSKIALNNRINAELEAMAKTVYDYWFVQFDFPVSASIDGVTLSHPVNNQAPGYKSSGGKMVWCEELKREVPEGWEVDNLLKVSNLEGGGTPNKAIDEYWNGEISFYTPSDYTNSLFVMKTESSITEVGLKNCSSKLFPKGSIFITARGTVGNVSIASENMAMNQSCYAFCEKKEYSYCYLYFTVSSLINVLKAKSGGSVFNSIVSKDIKHIKLPIPPENVAKEYKEICDPIFSKILVNQQENQQLSSLRDWLLPMLMNGQVKVGESV